MKKAILVLWISLLSFFSVSFARKFVGQRKNRVSGNKQPMKTKQLLVDVSVIINNDARTGIQRVVRGLLLQLVKHPPIDYRVCPIFATRKHGYCYASEDLQRSETEVLNTVRVAEGDVFLGLDLSAHLLPLHKDELVQWKTQGVKIHIVVYDLLPLLSPHWFNNKTVRKFRRWLKMVAIFSDSILCISNTVKVDVGNWLESKYGIPIGAISINTISLGADIKASMPDCGLPKNIDQLLSMLASKSVILMVGTLEPRKGHAQVLNAFECLWQQGSDVHLVIIGKPGWKTQALQQALRTHPQNQNHLYWLDDVSDELLQLFYAGCTGVIIASQAEGFGLPLIEALHYNKPILARDIPVFREVGGEGVSFFANGADVSLSDNLTVWLNDIQAPRTPRTVSPSTWSDSAHKLLQHLCLVEQASFISPIQEKGNSLLQRECIE